MAEFMPGDLGTINVQVKFGGIEKSGESTILRIGQRRIPISRLGSFVFDIFKATDDVTTALSTGCSTAAFVFGLHKSYPEISAWVTDVNECCFALDVEKNQKKKILDEIVSGRMKESVENALRSTGKCKNMRIKLIRILPDLLKMKNMEVKPSNSESNQEKTGENQQPRVGEEFKLKQMRHELLKQEGGKERLKKLIELMEYLMGVKKSGEADEIIPELMKLLTSIELSPDDNIQVYESLSKLARSYFEKSKFVSSAKITLLAAKLVKNIEDKQTRVGNIQDDLQRFAKSLTNIYSIKKKCVEVKIGMEDELGRKERTTSRTAYQKAHTAQERGKLAHKRKDHDEAIRCFEEAIKNEPKKPLHYLNKAEVHYDQKEMELCEKECLEALDCGKKYNGSDKNMAKINAKLGEVHLFRCNPKLALEYFRYSRDLHFTQDVNAKIKQLEANSTVLYPPLFPFGPLI